MTSTSSESNDLLAADATAAPDATHDDVAPSIVSTRNLQRAQIEASFAHDYAGLRSLIQRHVGDPQTAADLLNDAVCTAWEKWLAGRIAHPEQIAGYVFKTAMNLLRNHRRIVENSPSRRVNADALETMATPSTPNDGFEDRLAHKVVDIIRSMDSPRDRALLTRFYLDEEDKSSICKDLALSPAQFTKVLHRARTRLRELLESHGLKGTDMFSWILF